MSNIRRGVCLENEWLISYYEPMGDKGNKKKKKQVKTGKNGLPVFESDHDYLTVFQKSHDPAGCGQEKKEKLDFKNKHGVPVLDKVSGIDQSPDDMGEEDFETLLDEYYKARRTGPLKKKSMPLPLNKRLKRYPPVETKLDLHGYTAMNAQLKVKSFLLTCKNQGLFTVRIIVGKGLHSEDGPVLPDVVEDVVLKMKEQNIVIWHEWDKKKKSKSGSLIVYLKQFEQYE